MTRRAVRIAWVSVGICLALGMIAGLLTFVGPPDQPWHKAMREVSTLLDVAALMFWIVIFAIYWARKQRREQGSGAARRSAETGHAGNSVRRRSEQS